MNQDASDAIDDRLLAEGRHAELLARHFDDLAARARLRFDAMDADEVLQSALERIVRELARGTRHPAPFRVVVHQVLTWSMRDAWRRRRDSREAPFPAEWDVADPRGADEFDRIVDRLGVEDLLDALPEGDSRAMRLRYIDGLEIADIASRLGMSRNAVDQALFRGRRAVKDAWLDG